VNERRPPGMLVSEFHYLSLLLKFYSGQIVLMHYKYMLCNDWSLNMHELSVQVLKQNMHR